MYGLLIATPRRRTPGQMSSRNLRADTIDGRFEVAGHDTIRHTKPSQFRAEPPVSLKSKEWVADYNELKDYGGKNGFVAGADRDRPVLVGGRPAGLER
jgi:hypothetical protein